MSSESVSPKPLTPLPSPSSSQSSSPPSSTTMSVSATDGLSGGPVLALPLDATRPATGCMGSTGVADFEKLSDGAVSAFARSGVAGDADSSIATTESRVDLDAFSSLQPSTAADVDQSMDGVVEAQAARHDERIPQRLHRYLSVGCNGGLILSTYALLDADVADTQLAEAYALFDKHNFGATAGEGLAKPAAQSPVGGDKESSEPATLSHKKHTALLSRRRRTQFVWSESESRRELLAFGVVARGEREQHAREAHESAERARATAAEASSRVARLADGAGGGAATSPVASAVPAAQREGDRDTRSSPRPRGRRAQQQGDGATDDPDATSGGRAATSTSPDDDAVVWIAQEEAAVAQALRAVRLHSQKRARRWRSSASGVSVSGGLGAGVAATASALSGRITSVVSGVTGHGQGAGTSVDGRGSSGGSLGSASSADEGSIWSFLMPRSSKMRPEAAAEMARARVAAAEAAQVMRDEEYASSVTDGTIGSLSTDGARSGRSGTAAPPAAATSERERRRQSAPPLSLSGPGRYASASADGLDVGRVSEATTRLALDDSTLLARAHRRSAPLQTPTSPVHPGFPRALVGDPASVASVKATVKKKRVSFTAENTVFNFTDE